MSGTDLELGTAMHAFAAQLFPICRSITGPGVRQTLGLLAERLPGLQLHEVPTGSKCFDWVVPDEWSIKSAHLTGPDGERIVDFADHNLHVVSYSEPVDVELSLEDLQPHLHSRADRPDAIPYMTSYYRRDWGFCLPHRQRQQLKPGQYRAVIRSRLAPGALSYADLVLPGRNREEILLSTYACHPSMGNNELSGPVVTAQIAQWLVGLDRRYTYRIVFVPETIGAIVYLSRHLEEMRGKVAAGLQITCIGDDRSYSYLASRRGDTLADRAARHTLGQIAPAYVAYDFTQRGSDERQYCAPGIDLPVCSIMRTKYGAYPEYHSSDDDLSVITPAGLAGGYMAVRRWIESLEANATYRATMLGEPHLIRHGLRPAVSDGRLGNFYKSVSDLLAFSDGETDLLDIAERTKTPVWDLAPIATQLVSAKLLQAV